MRDIIAAAPSAVPILLVGPPGVGKTATVLSMFDHVEVVLVSTMTEEDISGLPYREGNYDYRTIPALFRRLIEADAAGKTTALFLDELDKARRSVADTLLTLVASRKVGDGVLPANTRIISACNPPKWGGGDGISQAMLSRHSVLEYVPNVMEWAAWARERYAGTAADTVVDAVSVGEIPLLDVAGEELDMRLTTPRTLTMALDAIVSVGAVRAEPIVRGLLTASVASMMLHRASFSLSNEHEKARSILRSVKAASARATLRANP